MPEREYDYGLLDGERFEPEMGEDDDPPFDLTRPHVMTALGPIAPEALGVALVHERLMARAVGGDPDPDLVLDDPHAGLAELEDFGAAGGRLVVDATAADEGRDAAAVAWIAARAPVEVVLVTGAGARWVDDGAISATTLAAGFIQELTEGIDGSEVRGGALLLGIDDDRALQAVAEAHRATGAPVLLCCADATAARERMNRLSVVGVAASRVIVVGLGETLQTEVVDLLATGAFVAFDGIEGAIRSGLIRALVDAGFADQLLVSGGMTRRSRLRAYGGGPGLVSAIERGPLALMEAGLSAPMVRRLLVENAARALTSRAGLPPS